VAADLAADRTRIQVGCAVLAVAALRPENMKVYPELATALRDFEFLAMGMAAPMVVTALAAFAVLALRDRAVWPRWVGCSRRSRRRYTRCASARSSPTAARLPPTAFWVSTCRWAPSWHGLWSRAWCWLAICSGRRRERPGPSRRT
jgi:hypothetical protein